MCARKADPGRIQMADPDVQAFVGEGRRARRIAHLPAPSPIQIEASSVANGGSVSAAPPRSRPTAITWRVFGRRPLVVARRKQLTSIRRRSSGADTREVDGASLRAL